MLNEFLNQIRANPRLRIGIWLILGILWLYGVLELRDYLQEVQDKHRAAAERVSRMQVQKSQTDWLTRVGPAKTMAANMENRLWHASSSGLAQAIVEDWLQSTLTNAGASQPQFKVVVVEEANQAGDEGKTMPSDLWKVRANLSFGINPANFAGVLSKIEFSERQVVIETMKIRNEAVPRVDMQIITYVQQKEDVKQDNKPLVSGLPAFSPPASPLSETLPPGLVSPVPVPVPASAPTKHPPLITPPQVTSVVPVINPFILQPGSAPPQTVPNAVPFGKNPFMP